MAAPASNWPRRIGMGQGGIARILGVVLPMVWSLVAGACGIVAQAAARV
jgi:hypothetical protein